MKGKKSLFAVNLTLIVCLVLSPMAVFSQSEEPNAPPAETIAEAPAEDTGSDPAAVSSGVEAVDTAPVEEPVVVEAAVVVEEAITEVKEETPQTDTVDDTVTEEKTEPEQPEVINEEVQESEDTVTDSETNTEETNTIEENKTVEETSEEETNAESDSSAQVDETAALTNSVETEPTDSEEIELDLFQGTITINDDGDDTTGRIKITGTDADGKAVNTSTANNSVIRVKQSTTNTISNTISIILKKIESFVTVILDSLNIKSGNTPISVQTTAEATVALELDGVNKLETTGRTDSAINKRGDGTLVIQDKNDTVGELDAKTNCTSQATGAVIGGDQFSSSVGSIVISSAKVTATSGYNSDGAAIGAGQSGAVKEIIIENSTVIATGSSSGAAIGGGRLSQAKVDKITIENSTVKATGKNDGAGIGAGTQGSVKDIFISNSTVTATGGNNSAAIGAGSFIGVENITIEDSTVEATAGGWGAAIGGGGYNDATVGNITIDNSNVTAEQTSNRVNAGALGGGVRGTVGNITIKGESIIDATSKSVAVKIDENNLDTQGLVGFEAVKESEQHFFTREAAPTPTPEPKPVVVPEQPKEEDKEEVVIPVIPVVPTPETPVEEKTVELVESKKDDDAHQSNIVIEGTTAKITVTDETGEKIDPHEVTIKSVAAFEETGAAEASIQLTAKLTVDIDIAVMKEAASKSETEDDAVTVTNVDSVITVKSGETALVSVDVKEVISATEETVTVKFTQNTVRVICGASAYHIDLTDLGDVGTLTLRLENGVLKIYDKNGNLLREIASA